MKSLFRWVYTYVENSKLCNYIALRELDLDIFGLYDFILIVPYLLHARGQNCSRSFPINFWTFLIHFRGKLFSCRSWKKI